MFDDAVAFVLAWEGGYVDDPKDAGGWTHWGISQGAYPGLDIPNLTREEAVVLYRQDYWERIGADSLPPKLALIAFNAAVNCGVVRARRWIAACNGDHRDFLLLQIAYYAALKKPAYIHGWLNRTLDAWERSKEL